VPAEQWDAVSPATGATWQEIADQLGYRSRQAASQAVKRLGDRTPPETAEQTRAKHDNALRLLQRGNFTRYLTALPPGASADSESWKPNRPILPHPWRISLPQWWANVLPSLPDPTHDRDRYGQG
jgi:hypothetical protein